GSHASTLIGCSLFLNGGMVTIKDAKVCTRTPQCQWRWKWGHTMDTCCHPAICCPICSGPHMGANHLFFFFF
ncbi:hypothetical protein P691DRAFT_681348, partial [Macrolepiota fuliginosa MF-IS2]